MLLETRCAPAWRTVVHGELSQELTERVADGVQAVDGLLLLQASPLLVRATTAELVRLAAIARIVPLAAGEVVFKPGDRAAVQAVITGRLEVTASDGPTDAAESGDVVGIYETLGGRRMQSTGRVAVAGTALRIERAELFELLADRLPLLQGIASGMLHASGHATAEAHAHAGAAH
jgi:CRP-like cAMP-binding protein